MSLWKEIEVCVPINIALVKYWGKRDEELMLPLNDSLSLTVDSLFAETSARVMKVDQSGSLDSVTLNEIPLNLLEKPRYHKCFAEIRRLLRTKYSAEMPVKPENCQFLIISRTNFPVSAGLASSAAGFAAIAFSLGTLFGFSVDDISHIARLGSGSATRSVYGGLVAWRAGSDPQGADCRCEILASAAHWPSLRAAVVVISNQAKHCASTDGMALSAATSQFLTHRVISTAPKNALVIQEAFLHRDFNRFAEFVMRESNQLHAVCMDTFPPLIYLNDSSHALINFVLAYNKSHAENRLAYTFDAGPNCCIFLLDKDLPEFLSTLCHYFPNNRESKFIRSEFNCAASVARTHLPLGDLPTHTNTVQYVMVSEVAGGPRILPTRRNP